MLTPEKEWLKSLCVARAAQPDASPSHLFETIPPPPIRSGHPYLPLAETAQLDEPLHRLALGLALWPHLDANPFIFEQADEQSYRKMGLRRAGENGRWLPTCETFLYVAAGTSTGARITAMRCLLPENALMRNGILQTGDTQPGDTEWSALLQVTADSADRILFGENRIPAFSSHFPAKRYTTSLDWSDMIFSSGTALLIEEVKQWLTHYKTVLADDAFGKRLGTGYKVLLFGPPGNGKSVTAALLGQFAGKEVLRIDLSMVVSKYIGETEKNLKSIFDRAERTGAILFFDEADSLFGKRTGVKDAHDRYANQEVNYLLQRLEAFSGIVFLATNFKNNLDEAFTRRFQTIVCFPMPEKNERLRMWHIIFKNLLDPSQFSRLDELAAKYPVSYAQVANVGAWCLLMITATGKPFADFSLIRTGLGRELAKEGLSL
jgi:hypothetical protein